VSLQFETTVGATNDYGDAGAGCGSPQVNGPDRAYEVTLLPGDLLTASVSPTLSYDPVLDLVAGPAAQCGANARVCLRGSDLGATGEREVIQYKNDGGIARSLFLIVDSVGDGGAYDLDVSVGPPPAGDSCSTATMLLGAATMQSLSGFSDDYALVGMNCSGNAAGSDRVYSIDVPAFTRMTATVTPSVGLDTSVSIVATVADCATRSCLVSGNAPGGMPDSAIWENRTASQVTRLVIVDSDVISPQALFGLQVNLMSIPPPPSNDVCSAAMALSLNQPVSATTVSAGNDYQITAACYAGIGNVTSTAPGLDVVFSFSPPTSGRYSFRTVESTGQDQVVYISSTCSSGTAPVNVATCSSAVNRNIFNADEELSCAQLTAGTPVFAYVDSVSGTGAPFELEVTRCTLESEPNDTPATADAIACPITGSQGDAGPDSDFFALPTAVAGSRLYAAVEVNAAQVDTFQLRVTTATATLQWDDNSGGAPIGGGSGAVAGTPLTGVATYLRVDKNTFVMTPVEPYHVYSVIQPASTSATAEVEPNETTSTATTSTLNYFRGALAGPSPSTDIDVFSFNATAGDLLFIGLDEDPLRDNTAMQARIELLNSGGVVLQGNSDLLTNASNTASPGTINGFSPYSPSETLLYRVRATGTYYVRLTAGSTSTSTAAGDYVLSVSKNCLAGP
jgi:hypothetical protein